ncbi:hypothetical protein ASE00_05670 [Sphingomonas sp. Root710]|uniref:hypothetical protein n=1 Tax=Sphingomonas sp. Root710 TaxID=1736594 RepID=UPI0006FCE127|nr:hypothetical protein [Sphingomonas sp. Root710]KRB86217.1 hypothetical protein ASE00_05670 [Sphingomonas sp. Root710]
MIIETDHHADAPLAAASRKPSAQPRLADVRRDMAAIFGENAITGHAGPQRTRPLRKAEPPPLPPARRNLKPAPLLAAGLAGLIVGMAAIGTPRLIGHAAPDTSATAPATTVAASPFEDATPPAAAAPAAAAPSAEQAAPSPTTLTPVKRPDPVRLAKVDRPEEPAKPPEKRMVSAEPASLGAQCEGDRLERHWCLRHDILKADRMLRLAYANAIREGVERRFLVAHQRRWTQLRDRASSDPDGVVAGYRELAEDLERLSVNGRRRDRI